MAERVVSADRALNLVVEPMANVPRYQLPADVADFAARYFDLLKVAVAARMQRVGVPSDMIGIKFWGVEDGAFVRYDPPQLGGNIRHGLDGKLGINVDAAVLDSGAPKVGSLPAWRDGSWKDRVDAVIAHEYTEVLAPSIGDAYEYAMANAEFTPLTITDRARQILQEYRESADA